MGPVGCGRGECSLGRKKNEPYKAIIIRRVIEPLKPLTDGQKSAVNVSSGGGPQCRTSDYEPRCTFQHPKGVLNFAAAPLLTPSLLNWIFWAGRSGGGCGGGGCRAGGGEAWRGITTTANRVFLLSHFLDFKISCIGFRSAALENERCRWWRCRKRRCKLHALFSSRIEAGMHASRSCFSFQCYQTDSSDYAPKSQHFLGFEGSNGINAKHPAAPRRTIERCRHGRLGANPMPDLLRAIRRHTGADSPPFTLRAHFLHQLLERFVWQQDTTHH